MADRLSDGSPNQIAAALQIRQLEVDRHGLEHSVMRYRLEIMRWEDNIAKHKESIVATESRMAELDNEITELGV